MKVYCINFNNISNFVLFRKNEYINIVIYNNNHFSRILINDYKYDFYINNDSKSICVNAKKSKEMFLLFNRINFFLKKIFFTFFFKIRFNGKGFRIQSFSNKKIMNFTFGYSHMYLMFLATIKYKRINKYKYFFALKNIFLLNKLKNMFKLIKPINKYTLRGLRISRSTIVKRKGRKSPNL